MRSHRLIFLFLPVMFVGCAGKSHEGLWPTYPKLTQRNFLEPGNDIPKVDSLCPTFKWKGLSEGETCDFAIWDAIYRRSSAWERLSYTPGMQIYHREGLKENSHKPDISLLPMKKYYWSVKLSRDEDWTRFNWGGSSGTFQKHSLFLFETPLKAKQ